MLGDINLFLSAHEDDDDDDDDDQDHDHDHDPSQAAAGSILLPKSLTGEIDIMIASPRHRGRGVGRAAVATLLHYIALHADAIAAEWVEDKVEVEDGHDRTRAVPPPTLKALEARIAKDNAKSIALFESLGFAREGEVNYFGEVKLVLRHLGGKAGESPEGYAEVEYLR